MTALGLSMIVGGTAFLLSGLIFLLPTKRGRSGRVPRSEQVQGEIELYLSRMRK
jgi:hypothetical protein